MTNLKGFVTSSSPFSPFSLSDMIAIGARGCRGRAWRQWLVAVEVVTEVKVEVAMG